MSRFPPTESSGGPERRIEDTGTCLQGEEKRSTEMRDRKTRAKDIMRERNMENH